MSINWELFHFMRPLWLAALPAVLFFWWLARKQIGGTSQHAAFVAPHLRDALTVNLAAQRGFMPADGVALSIAIAAVAAAGPTWTKQPSPWFSETAPLVVAIEVSDSMRSNDLQPTRLDRARFKLLDLIDRRTGSRTALIAYAGSAHVVMPPTKDLEVVKPFLESLDPGMMPEPGAAAATVLPLAQELLGEQSTIGTVLFLNDGFAPADVAAFQQFSAQPGAASLVALVVGSDEGGLALLPDGSPVVAPGGGRLDTQVDATLLRRMENEAGLSIVRASTGDEDIRQLVRRIQSNLALADDPDARWKDEAWWLLWPAAIGVLLWFRRGWTMQWS